MEGTARCHRAFNRRWVGDFQLGSMRSQLTTLWPLTRINLSKGLPKFGPAIAINSTWASTTVSAALLQSLNNCERSELRRTSRPTGSINISRKPCLVRCGRQPALSLTTRSNSRSPRPARQDSCTNTTQTLPSCPTSWCSPQAPNFSRRKITKKSRRMRLRRRRR